MLAIIISDAGSFPVFGLLTCAYADSDLDDDAMKTLVHAFITSRVDYCNAVLAGSPKSTY